jgi:hypothetical protein
VNSGGAIVPASFDKVTAVAEVERDWLLGQAGVQSVVPGRDKNGDACLLIMGQGILPEVKAAIRNRVQVPVDFVDIHIQLL